MDNNIYTSPGKFGGGAGTTWPVGSAQDVARWLLKYQALGITHFGLSDTPYEDRKAMEPVTPAHGTSPSDSLRAFLPYTLKGFEPISTAPIH